MSERQNKRKPGPGGSGPATKRSKGGTQGRWTTPHQQARKSEKVDLGTVLEAGDQGIWVTFARGMHAKTLREFKELCETYAKELYGIEPANTDGESKDDEDGEEEQDIEKAIEQELNGIRAAQKPTTRQIFTPLSVGIECVFFMKTMDPVQPDKLVTKICHDAKDCTDLRQRRVRYVNRITPVVHSDKATDKGVVKVAREALAPHFTLAKEASDDTADEKAVEQGEDGKEPHTYAIRHSIRNHSILKSGDVIKSIAALVDPRHKVNLGNPDKVVLVEIFRMFCGVTVVDGQEWEALKRYNVNENYMLGLDDKKEAEGKDAVGTTDKPDAKEQAA